MRSSMSITQQRDSKWYVLYTYPLFEKKIGRQLALIDIIHYLPVRTEVRKWSDRLKRTEVPLFPNYIFVKTNLLNKTPILSIPGVVRFVSIEGKAIPVSEDDINKIRQIEASRQDVEIESVYNTGDKIRILNGVFSGLEGELYKRSNRLRVLIKLPVIAQAVSVEISNCDIEKLA
ncbi:Transcription antitermination factor NusG [Chitinophaga sp. YR627]|uniref:NusG antitermination factor n=1 Tax=Chitinophaga sancti TaxID=1004 RepID=F5B9C1_9BACT|nr:UpxY family transcription antiterminator [Chitinophaga sp. YR627]AEC04347.1 NusG antitermination factor [Chitinophaga sancti]SFM58874.1 Transcription antitermination factor NusG [Chitinophaga sp. YR627]